MLMTNCRRWSETVTVTFPEIESGPRILEVMLLISVLDLLVTLGGLECVARTYEKKERSRNSLVGTWWSYVSRSTLKLPSRKIDDMRKKETFTTFFGCIYPELYNSNLG